MIQASDIYILAGVVAKGPEPWTLRELAQDLHVDHTLVHRSLKRAETAGLYRSEASKVHLPNFEELLIHAIRFLAPGRLGELVPGVAAAWAAAPMAERIRQSGDDPSPVWPSATGHIRGQALEPLHPAAVQAAAEFGALSELLSIIDSLRTGDIRVRTVASELLGQALKTPGQIHDVDR